MGAGRSRSDRERTKKHAQFSYHGENRAIRIRCLAHQTGSSVIVADDDDMQAEDLDMHEITCALQIRKRSNDRDDDCNHDPRVAEHGVHTPNHKDTPSRCV